MTFRCAPSRSLAARVTAAVAAGAVVWTSFPPLGWWPAAILGVAGLTLSVRGAPPRHAAAAGFGFGLGLWGPMLSFLRGLGIDAWVAVAVVESLWFLLLALALRVAVRGRWAVLATTGAWLVQEYLRSRVPFGGFPWGKLAFGQANGPLVRLAALGGAPLVTAAVALAGALLMYLLVDITTSLAQGRRPSASRGTIAGRGLVTLAAAGVVAAPLAVRIPTAGTSDGGRPSSAVVAVVQGNVPRLGLDEFAQKRAVTADHLLETERLSGLVANGEAPAPQAVIWPENSSDRDPSVDLEAREMLDAAAASIQAPILVGAVLDGPHPYQLRNTAIVWTPKQGPTQTYTKRHLVPFGEYIPFRHLVTSLTNQFALVPNDFVPGHRPGVLDVGPVRLADTICFEVADDSVVRQAVTGGGRLIAVQTNNADYESKGDSGHGGEPAQQLAMAQLRAVEHGRAVVVAATSGASAVISPDGRILARTGVFAPGVIDMRVPLRDPLTVADRLGPWPERVAVILASLWLLVLSRPRRRRSAAAGPVNEVDRSPSPALHS